MALSVTRTIASRGLMSFGSGTVSTRTSCRSCQQSARIALAQAARLPAGARGFARLEDGARVAQRIGDEPLRRASHYARERRAERAAARRVLEMRRHDGAAATGCVAKAKRAEMRELLATQPPPRKLLVGDVARDVHLGVGERWQGLRPREVGQDLGRRWGCGDGDV